MAVCEEGVEFLEFSGDGAVGGVVDSMANEHAEAFKIEENVRVKVPCKPLSAMLKDAKLTQIDLFSLDVEGAEFEVLKTMDW